MAKVSQRVINFFNHFHRNKKTLDLIPDLTNATEGQVIAKAGNSLAFVTPATGGGSYTHPATHPATMIVEDSTHRFTTDAEKTSWNNKAESNHNHSGVYEPANSNIQTHIASAHAPSNAQKNSDITKAEIEAKLTGPITTHSHAGGGVSTTSWGKYF